MDNLATLRAAVDLPTGYSAGLPADERKALLRRDLAEFNLRNNMQGFSKSGKLIKTPAMSRSRKPQANSDRLRIARFIEKSGPVTSRKISIYLGIEPQNVRSQISTMLKLKYITKAGRAYDNSVIRGKRFLMLVKITPFGREYGANK